MRNGDVRFLFVSPLYAGNNEIGDYVTKHGDTVKDIAFSVDDVDKIYQNAISRGVKSVMEPKTLRDEFGEVRIATLEGFEDVVHSIIDRVSFLLSFLRDQRTFDGLIKQKFWWLRHREQLQSLNMLGIH